MSKIGLLAAIGIVLVSMSGCARITTQVVERPRVDQEMQRGNQGYLTGSAPPSPAVKKTRKILEANIELATTEEMNPWRVQHQPAPAAPAVGGPPAQWEPEPYEEEPAPEEPAWAPISPTPSPPPAPSATPYTVQKGDTLQKISQKFYGTTQRWHRIYEANRNVLKSPDRLTPGQEIMIPEAGEEPTKQGAGSEFK